MSSSTFGYPKQETQHRRTMGRPFETHRMANASYLKRRGLANGTERGHKSGTCGCGPFKRLVRPMRRKFPEEPLRGRPRCRAPSTVGVLVATSQWNRREVDVVNSKMTQPRAKTGEIDQRIHRADLVENRVLQRAVMDPAFRVGQSDHRPNHGFLHRGGKFRALHPFDETEGRMKERGITIALNGNPSRPSSLPSNPRGLHPNPGQAQVMEHSPHRGKGKPKVQKAGKQHVPA